MHEQTLEAVARIMEEASYASQNTVGAPVEVRLFALPDGTIFGRMELREKVPPFPMENETERYRIG